MRHVSILGDDLEPLDRLDVADDIVQKDWAVFLDPVATSESVAFLTVTNISVGGVKGAHQGSSRPGTISPWALSCFLAAAVADSPFSSRTAGIFAAIIVV